MRKWGSALSLNKLKQAPFLYAWIFVKVEVFLRKSAPV